MITNVMIGAGIKIISNVINTYFENQKHRDDLLAIRDQGIADAQAAIAETASKDLIGKVNRSILFTMLVGTWCYMGIWCIHNLDLTITIPVDTRVGLFSRLVERPVQQTINVTVGMILIQWYEVMQMVIGFFCVPSRRR